MTRRLLALLVTALCGAFLLTACASDSTDAAGDSGKKPNDAPNASGTLSVFAAASLKESLEQIQANLEKANPDLTIQFQFGASGQLATQLAQGAPGDVFASADQVSMKKMIDSQVVSESSDFAKNVLQIVVPAGNPGKVNGLEDLKNADLTIVTCAPAAACGKLTATLESKVGYEIASDSEEPDVKSVLQKVAMGEADAGIVYVTDVKSQGDKVEGIDIPEAGDLATVYPIGQVASAPNPDAAKAFIDYVRSDEGQQILQANGFRAP